TQPACGDVRALAIAAGRLDSGSLSRRAIAFFLAAVSLANAGCPRCHNTSHCPKLTIRADWATDADGSVTIVEAGKAPATFRFGDDAKTDDVTCNASLETHVAGFNGELAHGAPSGQPPFSDVIRIGCGRATPDRGFVTLFGFTILIGDVAELRTPQSLEI